MPDVIQTLNMIKRGDFSRSLLNIYRSDLKDRTKDIENAVKTFGSKFDDNRDIMLFSSPGRAEICGSHTDHQGGCVITTAIDLDIVAVVSKNNENVIRIKSREYGLCEVDLNRLETIDAQSGSSNALVRSIVARFKQRNYKIGGFDAYTVSRLPAGSGLSSSAAFEMLIAKIISVMYNSGGISNLEMARAGQYAESRYYAKPCGLLDQLAIITGGLKFFDFYDINNPVIDKIEFDFNQTGYTLYSVKCPSDCHDLSDEYAAITDEMKSVAELMGVKVLSQTTYAAVIAAASNVCRQCGDRAFLRAVNYFKEVSRVLSMNEALNAGDINSFKRIMIKSGESSCKYLQNIYSVKDHTDQSATVALFLCEQLLLGRGSWRIHGEGFGGSVLALVPYDLKEGFVETFETVFHKGCVTPLIGRQTGTAQIIPYLQEDE